MNAPYVPPGRSHPEPSSIRLLDGIRVLELGGRGPVPFTGAVLADHGAQVIRIDRTTKSEDRIGDLERTAHPMRRNKMAIGLDIRAAAGRAVVERLLRDTDIVLEGFRPGVSHRLQLDASSCWKHNPMIVFGSATGWGSTGPMASTAGHDINFLALSGLLGAIGTEDSGPVLPLNIIGDHGAGALLAFGVVAGLAARQRRGHGVEVGTSIFESSLYMANRTHVTHHQGKWKEGLGSNDLQGGAPYYGVYRTADGGYMAVGAIERRFYDEFVDRLGVVIDPLIDRTDPEQWAPLRKQIADAFATRRRDEWETMFANSDCCVSPVLGIEESARHSQTMAVLGGTTAYEATPTLAGAPAPTLTIADEGEHTWQVLTRFAGMSHDEASALITRGVAG